MYCSNCGNKIFDNSNFCSSCGHQVFTFASCHAHSQVYQVADSVVDGRPDQWHSNRVPKLNIATFASGTTRAHLASLCLIVLLIIDFVYVAFRGMEYELMGRMLRGDYWTMKEAAASDDRIAAIAGVYFIFFIITAIVFCVWIYRAYSNLSSLGCTNLKHSPGWAVGWFFIPFANLWKPYEVTSEIWKASDPNTDINDGAAWQFSPVSLIIPFWWFSFVAVGIFSRIIEGIYDTSEIISELHTASLLLIVLGIVEIASIILAIIAIQSINNRQEKKRRLILSSRVY